METIKVKDWMAPLDECAIILEDATLYEAVLALEAAKERFDMTGVQAPGRDRPKKKWPCGRKTQPVGYIEMP